MDRVAALLVSPITALAVALLLGAIALAGKLSVHAALVLLVAAWVVVVLGISRAPLIVDLPWIPRVLYTALLGSACGLGMYYLGQWLSAKREVPLYAVALRSESFHDAPLGASGEPFLLEPTKRRGPQKANGESDIYMGIRDGNSRYEQGSWLDSRMPWAPREGSAVRHHSRRC